MGTRRIAALLTGTALAGSLLVAVPGTAYAAPVPVADAVTALHALDTASLDAAANGFTETSVFNAESPATLKYDPVSKIRLVEIPLGGGPVVKQLDTPTAQCVWLTRDALMRATVALAGLPSAEWVCRPVANNPSFTHNLGIGGLLADTTSVEPAPGGLAQVVDAADLTGTETAGIWTVTSHEAAGGSSVLHRTFHATVTDGLVRAVQLSLHLDDATPDTLTDDIVYESPDLVMPAQSHLISASRLALARDALTLRQRMARFATTIAVSANAYAKARHRVTIARDVAGWTRVVVARNPSGLVVYRSARTGVVLYGRNPFSRELVSYSVLVSHGRATVRRVA